MGSTALLGWGLERAWRGMVVNPTAATMGQGRESRCRPGGEQSKSSSYSYPATTTAWHSAVMVATARQPGAKPPHVLAQHNHPPPHTGSRSPLRPAQPPAAPHRQQAALRPALALVVDDHMHRAARGESGHI